MVRLDVRRRVGLHHLQVVAAWYHAERVAELVADTAGQLTEHGQLLAAHELLLGLVQGAKCLFELGGPFANPRVEPRIAGLDLVGHRVEGVGEPADFVAALGLHPPREVAGGDRFGRPRQLGQRFVMRRPTIQASSAPSTTNRPPIGSIALQKA